MNSLLKQKIRTWVFLFRDNIQIECFDNWPAKPEFLAMALVIAAFISGLQPDGVNVMVPVFNMLYQKVNPGSIITVPR